MEQSQNQEKDQKTTLQPQDPNARRDKSSAGSDPDVLLDSPQLNSNGLKVEIEDIDLAKILKIGNLKADIDGLEAQLLLEVRLRKVVELVDRILSSADGGLDEVSGFLGDGGILKSVSQTASNLLGKVPGVGDSKEQDEDASRGAEEQEEEKAGQTSQAEQDPGDSKVKGITKTASNLLGKVPGVGDSKEQDEEMSEDAKEQGVSGADQTSESDEGSMQQEEEEAEQVPDVTSSNGTIGETVNKEGQTVQRTVDDSWNIVETTLNESGEVVNERIAGSLNNLPVEEEFFDDEGRVISRMRDETGSIVEGVFDPEGNIIGVNGVKEG